LLGGFQHSPTYWWNQEHRYEDPADYCSLTHG
jgi:hypothetical protein